jgi:hypothetical protein
VLGWGIEITVAAFERWTSSPTFADLPRAISAQN